MTSPCPVARGSGWPGVAMEARVRVSAMKRRLLFLETLSSELTALFSSVSDSCKTTPTLSFAVLSLQPGDGELAPN